MGELHLVPAGAGAGKTHRIKQALTGWVRDGMVRPERMLAVTFTDAAAGELRQRIRASLLEAGLVEAALSVERAYVSTIHALGLRLQAAAVAGRSSPAAFSFIQALIASMSQPFGHVGIPISTNTWLKKAGSLSGSVMGPRCTKSLRSTTPIVSSSKTISSR